MFLAAFPIPQNGGRIHMAHFATYHSTFHCLQQYFAALWQYPLHSLPLAALFTAHSSLLPAISSAAHNSQPVAFSAARSFLPAACGSPTGCQQQILLPSCLPASWGSLLLSYQQVTRFCCGVGDREATQHTEFVQQQLTFIF